MRVEILSDQEFTVLKEKMLTFPPRVKAIFSLLLFCGLRNSEVCKMIFGDVFVGHSVRPSVFISAQSSKNGVSREVDLPVLVRDALSLYMSYMVSAGLPCNYADPLFITLHRKLRAGPRDLQRWVHTYSEQAIGRGVWPHVLRHTYATQLLKFTNLRVVQTLLGHKTILSTMIYTHPSSADCSAAVGRAFPATPESLVLGKGGCGRG